MQDRAIVPRNNQDGISVKPVRNPVLHNESLQSVFDNPSRFHLLNRRLSQSRQYQHKSRLTKIH